MNRSKPMIARLYEKIFHSPDGCWYWIGQNHSAGYGMLSFSNGKHLYAHRVSFIIHKGAIPEGMQVCHSCDNRLCVNPDHLWLGTNKDNVDDMVRKKRNWVFKHSPTQKLTEQQVIEIFNNHTKTPLELAGDYGISRCTIYSIKNQTSWKKLWNQ